MVETVQVSYCTVCDALPGECEHEGAARYLPDVAYERTGGGWSPPAAEREEWERRMQRVFGEASEPLHAPGVRQPDPLPRLLAELRAELDLDPAIEASFASLYERDAVKATAVAARVLRETRSGSLDRPEGFLAWRIRQVGAALT